MTIQTPYSLAMSSPRLLIQRLSATRLDQSAEQIDPQTEPMTALPLRGCVSAGQPIDALEDPDWVEVPSDLARRAQFALRVQGESMIDDQIEDGDLILIQPGAQTDNGAIVVALIDGAQASVKRLYREHHHIRLQPANPRMAPLRFDLDQVEVIGRVTAIVREQEAI